MPQNRQILLDNRPVGEVADSRHPTFAVGDKVVGMGGWQEYSVVDAAVPGNLRRVGTTHVPLSHCLGAVGSAFGALAKARGCRVVGIAGGADTCAYALTELGTLVATGKLRPRETVALGLEAAPEAFLGLLKGKNFGKQLVRLV